MYTAKEESVLSKIKYVWQLQRMLLCGWPCLTRLTVNRPHIQYTVHTTRRGHTAHSHFLNINKQRVSVLIEAGTCLTVFEMYICFSVYVYISQRICIPLIHSFIYFPRLFSILTRTDFYVILSGKLKSILNYTGTKRNSYRNILIEQINSLKPNWFTGGLRL